ncbi:serine/threonine protein kinase [Zafaria cholistanensis]|uniref:non-specific serine/threonine protein kinase n=1 Tax=Zafaria cholistanensis TaxID=1682741 RepID=A0A5A7NTS3_9MICC|nr:serine/threonine protein kinase [Zafaria cholistanensis]
MGSRVDGRYHVKRRLARGGMSTVYLATDLRLHRDVALKVLYPHLAEDPAFLKRFEAEAITAARLSHPHVVSVLDQGVDGHLAYLAMEYVRGRTLRDLLDERGSLAPRQALALMDPVIEGLAAAHAAGLVHRDMKPENVLLSDEGRIKVADFGLARAATGHTATGNLVGTVAYISPELITGEPADARSDVYAVGIMLYELLTGRQPFSAESPIQVAFQHVNESVPAPSAAVPGLASDLDELVEWCTARDPEDRPRDAAALLGELRHIRTTLTDEQLDFGAAGTAAAGPGTPGSLTEAIPAGGDATSVIAGLQGATRAYPRPVLPAGITEDGDDGEDDGGPDAAEDTDGEAGSGLSARAAARAARRDEKAARREWAREAQRPLERLEPSGSRTRGWILAGVLLLAAALLAVAGWFFGMGPGAPVNIPSLGGRTAAAAVQELDALGVDSTQREIFDEKIDKGLVVGSEPSAGTQIRRYEDVRLLVSKGPELFAVPNVVGRTREDAEKALREANLELGSSRLAYNESVDQGLVVSQATAPDREVRRGTAVDIVVSRGPAPVEVPDIEEMDAAEAERTLAAAGLKGRVTGEEFSREIPKGTVISQDPDGGRLDRGSTVGYVLSKGPRMVEVPDVVGQDVDDAEEILEELGFDVEVDEVLGGFFETVRDQDPRSGTAPEGSTITLTVV